MRKPMLHRLVATLLTLFAVISIQAFAQDASQVLRLSVGFNTLKNSVTLSDDQKKEVARLENLARAANQAGRYGEAMGHMYHAMAVMRNQPWTPARALGTALQLKSDRVILDPGDVIHLKVTQLFALEEPLAGKLTPTVTIAPAKSKDPRAAKELRRLGEVAGDFTGQPLAIEAALPGLEDGDYQLALNLLPAEGEPIIKTSLIRLARGLVKDQQAIKARAAGLAAGLEKRNQPELLRALAAVEYQAGMIDLANAGQLAIERQDFRKELSFASSLLEQIAKGENPLRALRGDFRWAYRSTVDQQLEPYRVYVPSKYDAAKPAPLVVALHGMGGDENSYFTGYDNGVIKREAEARGYIVVCPKGRGPASMYQGDAERDVLDVIAAMRRDYKIDEDRIYLTGHSMGGYGTWSIAIKHPELFAAIAPIAGGGNPKALGQITHVPEIVVHGDKDPTVPVQRSREMVKAGQELGIKIKYIEVPGGNHTDVAVPAMKDIFDWFDAHKRQPGEAAKAAAGSTQK
ncbi:MAG TPA: prolyl oligopeptidase family serine peptidase [Blastocatellia bacterium]|nr:prolyl oligopeptidase family serine peptidase [Blastocatellia bacterium]